jgi:predicted DNA binding CopG/RHH family protein
MTTPKRRKVPVLRTDEAAEEFLAQDLSGLDFRQSRPSAFEFARKEAQVNLRLPVALLDAVKARAKQLGIPYTRLIRESLEKALEASEQDCEC